MTQQELITQLRNALTQYFTIDQDKWERFGNLIQGFIGFKIGEDAHIVPFHFTRNKLNGVVDELVKLWKGKYKKAEWAGISFVQHYIHYTTNIPEAREKNRIIRP